MKVVGVIASPHAEGNGATLVRAALAGALDAGATVSEVLLSEYRIEFCRDCRACLKSGRCMITDDFQKVRTLLSEADGIILSSPTYGAEMSARIKNLFDRLGQYAFLTSELGGKYVVGIATAGSFGAAKVARQLAANVRRAYFTVRTSQGLWAFSFAGGMSLPCREPFAVPRTSGEEWFLIFPRTGRSRSRTWRAGSRMPWS